MWEKMVDQLGESSFFEKDLSDYVFTVCVCVCSVGVCVCVCQKEPKGIITEGSDCHLSCHAVARLYAHTRIIDLHYKDMMWLRDSIKYMATI